MLGNWKYLVLQGVQVKVTTKVLHGLSESSKYVQHFRPQNAMFFGRFGDISPRKERAGFYIQKEDQKNIQLVGGFNPFEKY